MSEQPLLLMFHMLPRPSDERTSAVLLRERAEWLPGIAEAAGLRVAAFPADSVKWETVGRAAFQSALEEASAVWWVGQAAYRDETDSFWTHLQRHLASVADPPKAYSHPDSVEESFDLSLQYHRLYGLPCRQAKSAFCRLDFDPVAHGADELATRLRRCLTEGLASEWDELSGEEGRVFFRTYYGTQKMSSYLNAARSFEDCLEGALVMVETLYQHQPIGGIAMREWLPIAAEQDDLLGDTFRREYRAFLLDGQVVGWVWQPGRLMADTGPLQKRVVRGDLDMLAPDESLLSTMRECGREMGRALRARFVAADFAMLEDGTVALLEVNPGHSSGWGHPALAAGVYGRWMQAMVGAEASSPQAICEAVDAERWGEGVIFGWGETNEA
jgi:hypothetical protein